MTAAPPFSWQVPPERPWDAPPIDYGDQHPFDPRNNRRGSKRRLMTDRQHTSSNHEPIRIGFDTTNLVAQFQSAVNKLSYDQATRLYLVVKQILPQVAEIWKDVLRVIPIQGSITPLYPGQSASTANYFCPSGLTSSTPGEVDLWIFVTFDRYCGLSTGEGSSFVYAVACERDQYDRPVTGAMDFCLQNMGLVTPVNDTNVLQLMYAANKTTQHYHNGVIALNWTSGLSSTSPPLEPADPNYAIVQTGVQTTIHATGRVLGLTSLSLPYFRNALTGKPFTPRPFALQSETCSNGHAQLISGAASANILASTITTQGDVLFDVITPLVRQVVRNQFACPTLKGARLQNVLNASDCYGSYWDERMFYQEMMTPFLSTTKNVLSPLTLAFFEDSSWYRANYRSVYVEALSFGHLAGCEFVEKNCIVHGAVPDYGLGSFCNSTMNIDSNGFVQQLALPQTCDPTHTFKASCDLRLVGQGETVPDVVQQYFPVGQLKIPKDFTQVNYCPVASYQPTDCTNPSAAYEVSKEYIRAGEKFGLTSKCVDVVTRDFAICLETVCNERLGKIELVVLYGLRVTCDYDGEIHTVLPTDKHHNESFQIKCPKLAQVCPQLICPFDCSGRGECVFNQQTSKGFCRCFEKNDTSAGCYDTSLEFIYSQVGLDTVPQNQTNVYAQLLLIGGIIGLLWMVHITSRVCEQNQRRSQPEQSFNSDEHNDDDDKTTFQKTFGKRKVRRKRHRDFRKDTEGDSVWGPRRPSSSRRNETRELRNPFL